MRPTAATTPRSTGRRRSIGPEQAALAARVGGQLVFGAYERWLEAEAPVALEDLAGRALGVLGELI